MEFTVIRNVTEDDFKLVLESMTGDGFDCDFTSSEVAQSDDGKPFKIFVIAKNKYIKVATSLENGWPFLECVIQSNKFSAMSIRYSEGELSEFKYWIKGALVRVQHALKDTKWICYGTGDLQDWEGSSRYSNRIVKNRLTAPMLESYLNACGYQESVA